jgi:hypothetical protein
MRNRDAAASDSHEFVLDVSRSIALPGTPLVPR